MLLNMEGEGEEGTNRRGTLAIEGNGADPNKAPLVCSRPRLESSVAAD